MGPLADGSTGFISEGFRWLLVWLAPSCDCSSSPVGVPWIPLSVTLRLGLLLLGRVVPGSVVPFLADARLRFPL